MRRDLVDNRRPNTRRLLAGWLGFPAESVTWGIILLLILITGGQIARGQVSGLPVLARQVRRPAALANCGEYVLCGNRRSGTLSIVDPVARKVLAEHRCGRSVTDVAALSETQAFVLDEKARHLSLVTIADTQHIHCETLRKLPPDPVRMAVDVQRRRVAIASHWSHCVSLLEWSREAPQPTAPLKLIRRVSLDFAPRELLLDTEQNFLIVADAFGGCFAVIDLRTFAVRNTSLPGHNIRGVAFASARSKATAPPAGRELMVSHQTLDRGWIDRDGVHWGIVMANSLRGMPLRRLRTAGHPQGVEAPQGWTEDLGLVGAAAGDPGPIVVDQQQRTAVALSGIHEVLISGASYRKQIPVGRRPVALLNRGDQLWVANQMDDSLSVIDKQQGVVAATVSLGPAPEWQASDRGEQLFYDARLSHDGWMSCHSCHTDGHTTGLLADTLGDGDYGAPKRIPSLLGVGTTGPWAWTGTVDSLPEQVRKSVKTTMHGRGLSDRQTRDIVAYLLTLEPPTLPVNSEMRNKGREVFQREGCVQCHSAPHYTSAEAYDVGVTDARQRREFNPPSLRGVSVREPLFHDGRYRNVEQLIRSGEHQLEKPLSGDDARALIVFLRSL